MRKKLPNIILFLIIAWYFFLILGHYLNGRPLWNDEFCVNESIIHQHFPEIFQQALLRGQQFPRVFLFFIQNLSLWFGNNVYILRLLPFVAMMIAFVIWFCIADRELKNFKQRILFSLCWVASIPLVYYAAELKQYSMDVCAAACCVGFLMYQIHWHKSRPLLYRTLLFIIPLLGLLSYPVFLFFPLIMFNVWRIESPVKLSNFPCWVFLSMTLLVVTIVYQIDLRVSNSEILQTYWKDYFISFASPGEFFKTLGEGLNNLISRLFAEDPKWIRKFSRPIIGFGLIYLVANSWNQFKQDRMYFQSTITIGALVLVELILLSMLHKYPFSVPRMSLFFSPILFLAVALAWGWLVKKNRIAGVITYVVMCTYLSFVSVGIGHAIWIKKDLGASQILWQK